MAEANAIWGSSLNVQKKGTPCRNPRKSGGSPSGVSAPPMLLMRKMKKTIVWTLYLLQQFERSTGLMRSMDAPVVPMRDASKVPMRRRADIDGRCPFQRSLDINAARHDKQRPQEDDERDIINDVDMGDLIQCRVSIDDKKGDGQHERPECRHFGKMMVPETGCKQREERYRKQNPDEGKHGPERQNRSEYLPLLHWPGL